MDKNKQFTQQNYKQFTQQNYKQFILDLPRLTLYLDNNICTEDSDFVNKYINSYLTKTECEYCIYFLTQTSVAGYFTNEALKGIDKSEHLIDDKGYVVKIDTKLKTIEVLKNFKKIYLADDIIFHLDFSRLTISCDLDKMLLSHDWDYDFDKNECIFIDKLI
jgi:hypothetical protein